jgi:hypothetical protein
MLFMSLLTLEVDQYVVYEYYDKSVQFWDKDIVHQVHKVGRSISQAK